MSRHGRMLGHQQVERGATPRLALDFDEALRLLDDALGHAETQGIVTLYTRPQSLDRVWVRNGFIPIPEADLPEALRGRPGIGLFGWRGGTAIWSMAGRAV